MTGSSEAGSHLVFSPSSLLGHVGLAGLADTLVLPVKLHQWETLGGDTDNLDLVTLSQLQRRRVTLQLRLSRPVIALDDLPGELGLHPHLELDGVLDRVELGDLIEETHPLSVHLSGHGVNKQGAGPPGSGQLETVMIILSLITTQTILNVFIFMVIIILQASYSATAYRHGNLVLMIITGTLYTERWPSLSSSLSTCGDDNNEGEALLQTPLTSSSCMAHCFSFLADLFRK